MPAPVCVDKPGRGWLPDTSVSGGDSREHCPQRGISGCHHLCLWVGNESQASGEEGSLSPGNQEQVSAGSWKGAVATGP